MSYILRAGIATPVSIGLGGTGQITANAAMTALSSAAFSLSGQTAVWGTQIVANSLAPTAADNFTAINNLIAALSAVRVIV